MFYGIPVSTQMKNFYAWSPSNQDVVPEWIDDVFPNAGVGNYIIYTKEPMKKFLVSPHETIVRCGLGSAVFYLILDKKMMQNWWEVNTEMCAEMEPHRPLGNGLSYQEYADQNIF